MSLSSMIAKTLDIFSSGSLKNILTGAGLGLGTSAFILTVLNHYIDIFVDSMSGLSLVGLFGISGLDVAFSVVIGALVMRATMSSQNISLIKKT